MALLKLFVASWFGWDVLVQTLAKILGVSLCLAMVTGCVANQEPIERAMNNMTITVIKPAVEKLTAELSTRTAQLQGQGSLINPGYVVEFSGGFGPTVQGRFSVKADGVSANIAGATQSDAGQAGTVPPPAIRTPTTKPVSE